MTWEEAVSKIKGDPLNNDLVVACYYDDPILGAAERFSTSSEWLETLKVLGRTSHGKVLDIGAGRGIASYAFAKHGWEVTALEPDNSDIVGLGAIRKLGKDSGLRINILKGEAESIPSPDLSFDLVYARQALHHANDLNKFCSEAFRVLRPGGIFLATREHVIDRQEDLGVFLTSHPLHKYYGGENAYRLQVYLLALRRAGFARVRILRTYDSDINLFPGSRRDVVEKIKNKVKLKLPIWFVCWVMNFLNRTPGRVYAFLAYKK